MLVLSDTQRYDSESRSEYCRHSQRPPHKMADELGLRGLLRLLSSATSTKRPSKATQFHTTLQDIPSASIAWPMRLPNSRKNCVRQWVNKPQLLSITLPGPS